MIRIAIVGCGRILNAHLQGYKALREKGADFHIVALVARRRDDALMFLKSGEGPPPRPPVLDPATGDPLAAPHTYLSDFQDVSDVAIYTDYRDALRDNRVDAVNDFTSVYMHHQIGLDALRSGRHLLTQKPLAISVKAAQRMVEEASARHLTFAVFENIRTSPRTRALGWAAHSGLLGQMQLAVGGSLGGLWSPDKIVAETPWRHRKLEAGGGAAIDIGPHLFDLLRYILGEVQTVTAQVRIIEPIRRLRDAEGRVIKEIVCGVDDTYLATATFASGAVAHLVWSWALHGTPVTIPGGFALYGTSGSIVGGQIHLDDGTRGDLLQLFHTRADPIDVRRWFPLGLQDPSAIQQYDWLRGIESGHAPETSGKEGLRDLAASYAMIESSLLGRTVTLDEVLAGQVSAYQNEINAHYGF
ncbi:MAG: Gfo/Idh/MocA family oxidoreductase [Anaerolineae bacterium]|nr:Gfo/Idh/MocA family oxidoreductase [Anaerolineae bacterium]